MDRPPVQDAPPPKNVIRFVNPVARAQLRSPMHRLLSEDLMLLTVTGRKTGRTYTSPVGRHESHDGTLVLSAGATGATTSMAGPPSGSRWTAESVPPTLCSRRTPTERQRP